MNTKRQKHKHKLESRRETLMRLAAWKGPSAAVSMKTCSGCWLTCATECRSDVTTDPDPARDGPMPAQER